MKICIPVMENKHLLSEVCGHFGKSPLHLVVESGTGEIAGLIGRGEAGAGECAPVAAMRARGAEAVVCQGLGRGALGRLTAAGMAVYRTECATVESVIGAFERGERVLLELEDTCAGHESHEHEGCGHGHD